MNISKNSWHYKTIRNMNRTPSRSLCLYFWQVVFCSLFLYIIGPGVLLGGGVCLAGGIPLVIGGLITHTPDADLLHWITAVKCWSVGLGAIAVLTAVVWFVVTAWNFVADKFSDAKLDKENGVLVSYIQAKKEKVCPIIEFKD